MQRRSCVRILCIFAMMGALLMASAAGAREQRPTIDVAGFQVAKRGGLSLEQAAARVQRQTGGRILSADALNRKGRVVYRIKVLMPSGHVRIFRVDAESGAAD